MSSSVHQSQSSHHQHSFGSGGPSLDFFNSALVSILSKKYPDLSLNDDAIMYIKYLVMKIIKILLSGYSITAGHSSTSPLTTSSGTTISAIGSTNGPTVGTRSSSSSSSVQIRLPELEERIKLLFPSRLDQEIIQKAEKILSDLNSSSHESTLHREGSLNENSSGTLKAKLSGKNRKPPSKTQKLIKINHLTTERVIHIPFPSFSKFFRDLLGGGKDIKFDPDPDVIIFVMVVIEFIVTEILESSGEFVSKIPSSTISREDINISMYARTKIKSLFNPDDEVNYDHEDAILCLQNTTANVNSNTNPGSNHSSSLCVFSLDLDPKFISKLIENKENENSGALILFNPDVSGAGNTLPSFPGCGSSKCGSFRLLHRPSQLNQSITYEDVVKELISEEKFFIRDLQLIIKLFQEPLIDVMKQQESDSSSLPSSPTSPTSPSLASASLAGISSSSMMALLNGQQSSVPSSPIHKSFGHRIKTADIDTIFSNITEIEELSVKLLCCLEDTLEAMISSNLSNDDVAKTGSGNNLSGSNPGSVTSMSKSVIESIGSVFHDFAEDQEFDVYETFALKIIGTPIYQQNNNNYGSKNNNQFSSGLNWSMSPALQKLQDLLVDPAISKILLNVRKDFIQTSKYVLPKLLSGVIFHCYSYFNYISILKSLSPSDEDKESFSIVEGLLRPLELNLGKITGIPFKSGMVSVRFGHHFLTLHHPGLTPPSPSSTNTGTMTINPTGGQSTSTMNVTSFGPLISYSTQYSVNSSPKIMELISKIDRLDLLTHQYMNCLILEGTLFKSSERGKSHSRISERKAFLFDGVLLLCKDSVPPKKSSIILNKQFLIHKIEVFDCKDPPPTVPVSASFSGASTGASGKDPCYGNSMVTGKDPSSSGQPSSEDQLSELPSSLSSPWGTSTTSLLSTSSNSLIPGSGTLTLASLIKSEYVAKMKNAFIIKDGKDNIQLSTETPEQKNLWISNLLFLTNRASLEKLLEHILSEEEKKNPLQVPSPTVYQFTIPDSKSNIIFEENKFNNAGAPLIKAATMAKLIERLTFHLHADPTFVRVFLTTYRSFSTPRELFTYLTKRFNVPPIESKVREDIKKFEKDYVKPVQLRVLNVIRHWVDQHYYDFTNDEELLNDLINFLNKNAGKQKNLKKWVDSILKNIHRNSENSYKTNHAADMSLFFNSSPPHFEWHIVTPENVSSVEFNLLTIHPIEFARQFTLLEYELFKKVKPSELVDCAWTKKDKEKTSPNLLKFTNFGNNFTYWLEQQILETENFEERVAVYSRILEILQVFQELNNFDGIICTVAALTSASVHRLESTKEAIPKALKRSFEEAEKLNQGHHKKYFDMLRSINPPCVPFLGKYLTYIVQIHEGNSDETRISVRDELRSYACGEAIATSTHTLINFSKRRKIAEITQEIQQYQNTPYCLNQERYIREFLESIKPLESNSFIEYLRKKVAEMGSDQIVDVTCMDKDEKGKYFGDYLHEMSLDIEPRKLPDGSRRPVKKAERRWPDLSLKSPGIKPSQAPPVTVTVTSNTISNTLSRYREVFASAVATSGLSSNKNSIQSNNLNEISLPLDFSSTSQISPNAVTLTLHSDPTYVEKDHFAIHLPCNPGSLHHHHVRQSSLNQPHQGSNHSYQQQSETPLSQSLSFSDHSVFANVVIGHPLTPIPSLPITPGHSRSQFSFSGSNPPPALPPRRQRLASTTSQSYDESMSSYGSGGSNTTLQAPPRPPHPITPRTPSTPGSSSTSGQSQIRNIFNFPNPLPPPEATPPMIPPRPEKLSKLISTLSTSSESTPSGATASIDISDYSPPPLPPRGVQPQVVNRQSFHRGSSSHSFQISPPSNVNPS